MSLDVFDTYAKVTFDSSDYDKGLKDAKKKTDEFASGLKSTLGGIAKGIGTATLAAVGAASAALAGIVQQAVSAHSEYEQLVGGVKTLFAESSDVVMKNAEKAYRTAGMSANQYMETVTSFASSLIQSTGRGAQTNLDELEENLDQQYKEVKRHWEDRIALIKDSAQKTSMKRQMEDELEALKKHNKEVLAQAEAMNMQSVTTEESLARAAELADMAIVDMSDNANKLGTTIESIRFAYQGFAKGNFTMLDNLKLGYGGTRAEMERLLQDAERIKQAQGEVVDYSISSYADIVEAIHAIQESMGIAETTRQEAEGTFSGSLKMVQAAWQDLLVAISDDSKSTEDAINNLVGAAEGFAQNMIPLVEQAMYGVAELIEKISPVIMEKLPGLIETLVPMFLQTVMTIVNALVMNLPLVVETIANGLIEVMPQLVSAIISISDQLLTTILPTIFELGLQLVLELAKSLADNADLLLDSLVTMISRMIDVFIDNLPAFMDVALKLMLALTDGILNNLQPLLDAIVELIGEVIYQFVMNYPKMLQIGTEIVGKIALGILMAIPMFLVSIGRLLGIVDKAEEDVRSGTSSVRDMVDDSSAYVSGSLNQLNSRMSQTENQFQSATVHLNDLTDDTLRTSQDIANRISDTSKNLRETVNMYMIDGVMVTFNLVQLKIEMIIEKLRDLFNQTKATMESLGEIYVKPTVDASGVISACDDIVSACRRAIAALIDLGAQEINGARVGTRAEGGWVSAGQSYLVGERGPELITPSRSGYVHTAEETAGMLGRGAQVVINIEGDVYDDENSFRKKLTNAVLNVLDTQVSYG